MTTGAEALNFLSDLVARARAAGADAADAILVEGASLSHAQRLGKPERLERSENQDLGLRVFIGRQQAIVSASDRSAKTLKELVERSVAMARAAPEDPYCGLADPADILRAIPDLDLADSTEPTPQTLIERAKEAEEAALAVPGVTNSEGAEAGWSQGMIGVVASNGFSGSFQTSRQTISVSALAGQGTGMETDYDYTTAIYGAELESPRDVGRRAGERAVRRLSPRKAETAQVPVVYEQRVANGIVRNLAGAINGSSIARGTSFLKSKMGQAVFGPGISIIDDPLRRRGFGSRPFDIEGLAGKRRAVIDKGVLTTWILDLRSARQLGLKSTGHGVRGTSSTPSPSPSNLYMEAGEISPKDLIGGIKSGLFVTSLMGMGVNMVTGDYSRGASGFWIENGELAYPVSEVTVAGNLNQMFKNLTPANDLVFKYGTDSPTIAIEGMTVAGR
ncbi:MAG: TldD/PmbA family protein [Rhodospirillaceae bacterium]|nr:TldD/PmbA family protein [Rhodospirillaceae bacterium]